MKFFCAAAEPYVAMMKELDAKYLVSYYSYKYVDTQDPKDIVFLDSGAFTAFTKKKTISIEKYGAYLQNHGHLFELYANLDVIGSAEDTYANQKRLEAMGVSPLPVVHYGADLKWLHLYAQEYPYIALGGLVPYARESVLLHNWLNKCFKELLPYIKEKGLKVHGFGVGSPNVLKKYPFFSADSSGWLVGGKFGRTIIWDPQEFVMRTGFHYKDRDLYLKHGGTLKFIDHYLVREAFNIQQYQLMQDDITRMWAKRGFYV